MMKLPVLLASIALVWCLLGAIVLGPGLLVYPLAWGAVLAVLFAVHKVVQLRNGHDSGAPRRVAAARPAEMPREDSAALAR